MTVNGGTSASKINFRQQNVDHRREQIIEQSKSQPTKANARRLRILLFQYAEPAKGSDAPVLRSLANAANRIAINA